MKELKIDDSYISFSTPKFHLGQFVGVPQDNGSELGWIIGIQRATFTYEYLITFSDSNGNPINDCESRWFDQLDIEAAKNSRD